MDLTDKPTIKTAYEVDPDTNILTITFKDSADVEIGTLVIENVKYKSLMAALQLIASDRITSVMTQVGHRTIYRSYMDEGETIFV